MLDSRLLLNFKAAESHLFILKATLEDLKLSTSKHFNLFRFTFVTQQFVLNIVVHYDLYAQRFVVTSANIVFVRVQKCKILLSQKCSSEAILIAFFVLPFAIKYYHFCWMKCCSFCTGSRSMCIWGFLTNLT